jgi:hypothetical protein
MAEGSDGVPTDELKLLLIVYELAYPHNGDERSDAGLLRALERYSAHTRLTERAWVLRTQSSVASVFDALDRHLRDEDRLFVASMTGEAAWRNIERGYDWIGGAFAPGARTTRAP